MRDEEGRRHVDGRAKNGGASGFVAVEDVVDATGGAPVPLVRMRKPVSAGRDDA